MNTLKALILSVLIALPAYAKPLRVACVGDSITEGTPGASYPDDLQAVLGPKYVVGNFGAGARGVLRKGNLPYWIMPQYVAAQKFHPDIVIINFGLNDTKPQNWQYGAEFKKDYVALIRKFQSLKSHPKVFICIPTPLLIPVINGITQSVIEDELIPQIKNIARLRKLPLIDLHTMFWGKEGLQPDFIHPGSEGAQMIAEKIAKRIKSLD